MALPIRSTKLYLPRQRSKEVWRGRLIERLDEGLERELTLVSAPAGFGKTTLVAQWVAAYGGPVAWLSLDEGDNDPARFLAHLLAALQAAAPGSTDPAGGTPGPGPQPPSEATLTALLNRIAVGREPTMLVLDDYHVIHSPAVDRVMRFLLQHLPHQLHLVIVTREDPRLPLARLRVRNQLVELRAADLRFTTAEATEFFREDMGLALSEEAAARLVTRTEGWIAGVQLAALSLRGREDSAAFIDSFTGSHRFVFDYLAEEVLRRQPAQVREFLLRTCILERMTGALCEAVTGQEGGSAMLARLESGNFFVLPLDDERRWYRYHRLFADALNAQAAAELGEERTELHLQASQWYESQDLLIDAVHHALAAQAFGRAADLIELALPRIRRARQGTMLLAWQERLPTATTRSRPVLSAALAGALLNDGRIAEAESYLRGAEAWAQANAGSEEREAAAAAGLVVVDEQAFRHLPVSLAMYRAGLAQVTGDASATARHAERALELAPEDDNEGRGAALALLGLAAWSEGDLDAAQRRFAADIARLRRAGFVPDAISGMAVLAEIRAAQGRLRDAVTTTEGALRLAAEVGDAGVPGSADLLVVLSELHLERNELSEAARSLERAWDVSSRTGRAEVGHRWWVANAGLAAAKGNPAAALAHLGEAERRYARGYFPNVRPIPALRVRTLLTLGRLEEALDWVREPGVGGDHGPSYLREYGEITLARVLLQSSNPGVTGLLTRLLRAAEAGGRVGSQIEVMTLLALAYQANGESFPALELLESATGLAAPEGYVRPFLEGGAPMARALRELEGRLGEGHIKAYARRLLAALDEGTGAHGKAVDAFVWHEPLTARELEVLRLIATGLSNLDIARRLHRAVSTIKGHNQVIFEKLQVGSRTEAIARGRELGLV